MRRPGMGPRGVFACWLTLLVVMVSGCLPVGHGRMVIPGTPPVPDVDAASRPVSAAARARGTFGSLPLLFVENHGQTDPRVTYYVHGSAASVFFGPQTVTHVLRAPIEDGAAEATATRRPLRQWGVQVEMV